MTLSSTNGLVLAQIKTLVTTSVLVGCNVHIQKGFLIMMVMQENYTV